MVVRDEQSLKSTDVSDWALLNAYDEMLVAAVDMHMLPEPHEPLLLVQPDVEHTAAVGLVVGALVVGVVVGVLVVGTLVGFAVGLVTGEHVVMLLRLTPELLSNAVESTLDGLLPSQHTNVSVDIDAKAYDPMVVTEAGMRTLVSLVYRNA